MSAVPRLARKRLLALMIIGVSCHFLLSSAAPTEKKEIVSIERTPRLAPKLQPLGLDLLFEWDNRVYVLAGHRDLRALERSHIPYLTESRKFPALTARPALLQGGINGDYHSYLELEAGLQDMERAHPEIARLYTVGVSLENRNIYALKISDNVASDEEEAKILFLGCHHAREWISVEVPFLLAKHLLENYATDAAVRRAVDQSEVWIVPLVNPDGLEYSIHFYRYWRKNRRLNTDGSFGVDLNRNYGYNWAYDNEGSSPLPPSEVYRGSAPFSEPETRAVRDLFVQREFQALVSYHSYTQVILYPWGYAFAPTDKEALHGFLAADMSTLMEAVNGRFYGFGQASQSSYLTNGDAIDWAFGIAGIPAFTIELPPVDQLGGGFFNAERDIIPIFNENLPAALYLIDWSMLSFRAIQAQEEEVRPDRLNGRGKSRDRHSH